MFDLERPPYRDTLQALKQARTSPGTWSRFAYRAAHSAERADHDRNEAARWRLAHMLLLFGVASDVALVRFLLDAEIQARRTDSFQGAGDALTILSLLLVEWGQGETADLVRFWRAKRANFDTYAGGYDIDFVFCQHPPEQVFAHLAQDDPDAMASMKRYDPAQILAGLPRWRRALRRRYPRSAAELVPDHAQAWAEAFGDTKAELHYGLQQAQTPADRARLYARLGHPSEALSAWREAAERAESPWDEASALRSAIVCAAQAGVETLEEVQRLDALRGEIPNWGEVGLGRMATQACFSLAAACKTPAHGQALWRTARSWQAELTSFTLVGLRAAQDAAALWGTPEEQGAIQAAHDAEHARIYGEPPL